MQSRMLKFTPILVTVLLVPLLGCESTGTTTVQASSSNSKFLSVSSSDFVLLDENGNQRGQIFGRKDGSEILLMDECGRKRIGLFATDDSAGFYIKDSLGNFRVLIGTLDQKGLTYVIMYDNKDNPTVLGRVQDEGPARASQEEIQRDAKRLLEKLKSGWLEGLREIDKQGR